MIRPLLEAAKRGSVTPLYAAQDSGHNNAIVLRGYLEKQVDGKLKRRAIEEPVSITTGTVTLEGDLGIPEDAPGIVLFAHGSGSSRLSPRNLFVARFLREAGLGTLLFDLLTRPEETEDMQTANLRFDIPFLARRLAAATRWLRQKDQARDLNVGYFGASTGAAAALVAAAELPEAIRAVVSRGGRPDLALEALPQVRAPTLLIVGAQDFPVISLNREAFRRLKAEKELVLVPRATHLFEEPGALEEAARLARDWFLKHLAHTSQSRAA